MFMRFCVYVSMMCLCVLLLSVCGGAGGDRSVCLCVYVSMCSCIISMQERVRERRGDEEEKQALTDSLLASQKCLEEV